MLCAAGAFPVRAQQPAPSQLQCDVVGGVRVLPATLRETSGLAVGSRGRLWTHNDSGTEPQISAVDSTGALVQQVRLEGAKVQDWEDIESAPCGDSLCLWIADTGDNARRRALVSVYTLREPEASATTARVERFDARYPPRVRRDAEALFVHGARPYLVTKGRGAEIELYRFPAQNGGELERIAVLAPMPRNERDRVTAASASPDGRWIVIRTYRTLQLHPAHALLRGDAGAVRTFDLAPLGEQQGEAVTLSDGGVVWLSTEAERKGTPGLRQLRCTLPQ